MLGKVSIIQALAVFELVNWFLHSLIPILVVPNIFWLMTAPLPVCIYRTFGQIYKKFRLFCFLYIVKTIYF